MRTFWTILAVVALLLFGFAPAVEAQNLTLEVKLGETVIDTVVDTDGDGIVEFSGTVTPVPGFSTVSITGISKPVLGSDTLAHLSLSGVAISSAGGELTATLTDTFLLSPSTGEATLTSGIGGTTAGSTSLETSVSAGATTGLQGPFGPGAFDDTATTTFTQSGAFSMTMVAVTALGASSIQSFGADAKVVPPDEPPGGGEGFTPGYWKNATENWVFFTTADSYEAIFGVDITPETGKDDLTLLEAIKLGGGGAKALIRHSVAAILNAAHPNCDYLYTVDEIIDMVQAAFATGEFTVPKDLLVDQNEAGGSLDD